jgi:hypothetical protein
MLRVTHFLDNELIRWLWGCQPYTPVPFYPPGTFLVLTSVRGWLNPRVIMQLEGLHHLKNLITSSPTVILILYSSKLQIDSLIKQLVSSLLVSAYYNKCYWKNVYVITSQRNNNGYNSVINNLITLSSWLIKKQNVSINNAV